MPILTPEQFRAKYCKNDKPKNSWSKLDFIPLFNGARWGDCDEMPSVNELAKPRIISFIIEISEPIVKPKTLTWVVVENVLEEGEIDESDNESDIEVKITKTQIEFSIDDDERPPPIWRPAEHGYCLFCEYQIHSNPPPHFTTEQRKHCCGWCQTSLGRGHGPHCQRCP